MRGYYQVILTASPGYGIPEKAFGMILSFEFETFVEMGKLQFSSDERRRQIEAIVAAYVDEFSAMYEAERDEEEVAREKIWDKYGIE